MNTQSQLKFGLTSGLGRWMVAAGLSVAFLSNAFAEADPNLWPVMKEAFFAKREMQEVDFIKIDAPKRAERSLGGTTRRKCAKRRRRDSPKRALHLRPVGIG